ncbi:dockerin type I domain-containing protein [Pseudobacteroides cellulosolvens]|uniref:Dockerin domain-containing protein n=1 Tax=Pseudobacteroides cellulosolvens ATCC 35603 = DSM 2933 TaxID=398512 RepID=A0A0L6JP96_9FIRM|nr:dockerin type I domain-containing protein [Pseudobacteroides cellulosolvens]KNY27604.1 hypothetical protein Bccel_2875 [Pseudobacteroides cellulosolvens ATCC 35603 = DSM 2933]
MYQHYIPEGLKNIKQVSAGMEHTLVLKNDGSIIGFGMVPFIVPNFFSNEASQSQETGTFTISGFISPDIAGITKSNNAKENFDVELVELKRKMITGQDGYFKFFNVPRNLEGYTIKVTNSCYFERDIPNIIINNTSVELGTIEEPIFMWGGDFYRDNVINMQDLIILAKVLNVDSSDEKYSYVYDLNRDKVIDMKDVFIIARHFCDAREDYGIFGE